MIIWWIATHVRQFFMTLRTREWPTRLGSNFSCGPDTMRGMWECLWDLCFSISCCTSAGNLMIGKMLTIALQIPCTACNHAHVLLVYCSSTLLEQICMSSKQISARPAKRWCNGKLSKVHYISIWLVDSHINDWYVESASQLVLTLGPDFYILI